MYFPSIWGSPHIGQMSEPCSCLCVATFHQLCSIFSIFCSRPDCCHTLWLVIWIDFGVCEDHDDWMMSGIWSSVWNMAKCLEWWLVKCLEYDDCSSVWNMMIGQMSGSLRALGWFITIKYSPPLVSFVIQTCALPGSGVSAANFSVRSITVNTVQIQYSQVCFQLYQIVPRPCRWLTDYKTTRPFWNTQSLKRDV